MRAIELNAEKWVTLRDFYDALLAALGSPKGHGRCGNALVDSVIWGGMNKVEAPYVVRIVGTSGIPQDAREEIAYAQRAIARDREDFREWRGRYIDVYVVTDS